MSRSGRVAPLVRRLRPLLLDPYLRRLAGSSGWLYLATAAGLFAAVAQAIVAARFLGPADYGRVGLVIVSVGAVKQLVDVRTWEFVTRYLAEFAATDRRGLALATLKLALLSEYVIAAIAFAATVAASGLIAGRLLHNPDLRVPIIIYAVTLPITALNGTATASLRVFDRFRRLALHSSLQSLLRLALVTAVLLPGGGVRAVAVAYLTAESIGAALLAWWAGAEIRRRLWDSRGEAALAALRPYLGGMLTFMAHSAFRATLKLGNRNLDLLLLGHYRPAAEVGYYRIARSLAGVALQLTDPLYFVVFPEFARFWATARDRFLAMLRRAAGLGAVVAVLALITGLPLAPLVFRLAAGDAFSPAVEPFRFLVIAMAVAVAAFWATPAALGAGLPGAASTAFAAGVAVQATLLALLVPDRGPTGAAIAFLGFYLVWAVVILALLARGLRAGAGRAAPASEPISLEPAGPDI